ncbi:hypothetical protein RYX36_016643 [Vicia faba]
MRQFYHKFDIYRTVDFILGNTTIVFQNCNLYPCLPSTRQFNAKFAQGRTNPNQSTGTSIHNSTIKVADDLALNITTVKTSLGRTFIQRHHIIPHNPTVSSRIYLPKIKNPSSKFPILVYFHGGALLFESAFSQLYHQHLKILASQANIIILSVEYRLAPEHPVPACYHDCWAALKWVSSHSNNTLNNPEPWLVEHGYFARVFIGGDSAGGNITHNIAIQAGAESLLCDVKILGAIMIHPNWVRTCHRA